MDNAPSWIRADNNWIWNYLTIHEYTKDFTKTKCNICNGIFELRNRNYDDNTKRAMKEHIFSKHTDIFIDKLIKSFKYIQWSSNYIKENLKQVKCLYCEFRINFSLNLVGRPKMVKHMFYAHKITEVTNELLVRHLRTEVKDYYELNEYAQEQYCKKCSQSQKSDFIILLKHLIDTHHHDVPAYIIPKGLQNSSASTSSGNVAELLKDFDSEDNFDDIPDDGFIAFDEIQISEYLSTNQPSSDPIDIPSTSQKQPSIKRKISSSTSTEEESKSKKKKNPKDNSNNEEDD